MEIDKNKVVTFHYSLTDAEGDVSESSHDAEPVSYLNGHGGLVPGLELAMRQCKTGDTFEVTLTPDQGYGEYDPNAAQRVPIKRLVRPGKLSVGQAVIVQDKDGQRSGTVIKVGHFNVDLDMNHPLAGKTLTFEIQVVDVREATPDELAHVHVHGPGGTHH